MNYSIRRCETREELAACVNLQKQIWGYSDADVYPLRLFVNLTRIGGQVLGAFTEREKLVGFLAAMPAWHGGQRYFHSLALGVAAGHENRGLGRGLKVRQRDEALRAGVALIEWTYDPMRAKNAFFNLERLGAIVRRYVPDYYGPVASRLQQGLPTDRLACEWWLKSRRVACALEGKLVRLPGRKPAARVSIPADFAVIADRQPRQARALQTTVRRELQKYLRRGLAITGLEREDASCFYLLDRYDENTLG